MSVDKSEWKEVIKKKNLLKIVDKHEMLVFHKLFFENQMIFKFDLSD